ncbi:hypothetical protein [Marinobacter sp. MDS2]|uniref:hypothetical protein n=1 Tax=Marinobacter sp. MDS2 TaxID=3065961 RepID=UPI0035304FD7
MSIPIKATLAITLVWPAAVVAGLEPISDRQLSEVTGQAFVSVDRQFHPDPADNTAYTRVNLGMDIEVQTNEADFQRRVFRLSYYLTLPICQTSPIGNVSEAHCGSHASRIENLFGSFHTGQQHRL